MEEPHHRGAGVHQAYNHKIVVVMTDACHSIRLVVKIFEFLQLTSSALEFAGWGSRYMALRGVTLLCERHSESGFVSARCELQPFHS